MLMHVMATTRKLLASTGLAENRPVLLPLDTELQENLCPAFSARLLGASPGLPCDKAAGTGQEGITAR